MQIQDKESCEWWRLESLLKSASEDISALADEIQKHEDNELSLHTGEEVLEGRKVVANLWIWDPRYRGDTACTRGTGQVVQERRGEGKGRGVLILRKGKGRGWKEIRGRIRTILDRIG